MILSLFWSSIPSTPGINTTSRQSQRITSEFNFSRPADPGFLSIRQWDPRFPYCPYGLRYYCWMHTGSGSRFGSDGDASLLWSSSLRRRMVSPRSIHKEPMNKLVIDWHSWSFWAFSRLCLHIRTEMHGLASLLHSQRIGLCSWLFNISPREKVHLPQALSRCVVLDSYRRTEWWGCDKEGGWEVGVNGCLPPLYTQIPPGIRWQVLVAILGECSTFWQLCFRGPIHNSAVVTPT